MGVKTTPKVQAITVRKAFTDCQKSVAKHSGLLEALKETFIKEDEKAFCETFIQHLRHFLIYSDRQPIVERSIEFAVKFISWIAEYRAAPQKQNLGESPISTSNASSASLDSTVVETSCPFLVKFFSFLFESHLAQSPAVRFRVCEIINKLLNSFGEEARIDNDLWTKIYECMLDRLQDKVPAVRVQAVLALMRLQDPRDKHCPVIRAYIFHLTSDPSAAVRRAVLASIAASYLTLPHILERTRDIKDDVRRDAYIYVSKKVHIKSLSIAQRERLLKEGLNDRTEMVRSVVEKTLLPSWLNMHENGIIGLLKSLDVEQSHEVATTALNLLFSGVSYLELIKNFLPLNQSHLVEPEDLSVEASVYWRGLVMFLKKEGGNADNALEDMLPTLTDFCNYIKKFLFAGMDDVDEASERLRREFIVNQLLHMIPAFDLADEVGRKNLVVTIREILVHPSVTDGLVCVLVMCAEQVHSDVTQRVNHLTEIISESRFTPDEVDVPDIAEPEVPEMSVAEKRQVQLKLAKVHLELQTLRDELEEAVNEKDFVNAQKLKEKQDQLNTEKDQYQQQLQKTVVQEVKAQEERNDPATLMKCLTIVYEMLQSPAVKKMDSTIRTLLDDVILPCIQNPDPGVRNIGIRALGVCCLLEVQTASRYLGLFIQICQMDLDQIKMSSAQVIFDLLLRFGLEKFNISEGGAGEELDLEVGSLEEGKEGTQGEKRDILVLLTDFLDTENADMRTIVVEGLCKLLINSRISSSKLLTRLILLWYKPTTEGDALMRHLLGVFFPVYSSMSRQNQDSLDECYLPTILAITEAPITSPVGDIDAEEVSRFILSLTRDTMLHGEQPQESNVHTSLAFKICNKILEDPEDECVRVLLKSLPILELNPKAFPDLRDLKLLSDKISQVIKERIPLKFVEKFSSRLSSYLQLDPGPEAPEVAVIPATPGKDESVAGGSGGDKRRTLFASSQTMLLHDTDDPPSSDKSSLRLTQGLDSVSSLDISSVTSDSGKHRIPESQSSFSQDFIKPSQNPGPVEDEVFGDEDNVQPIATSTQQSPQRRSTDPPQRRSTDQSFHTASDSSVVEETTTKSPDKSEASSSHVPASSESSVPPTSESSKGSPLKDVKIVPESDEEETEVIASPKEDKTVVEDSTDESSIHDSDVVSESDPEVTVPKRNTRIAQTKKVASSNTFKSPTEDDIPKRSTRKAKVKTVDVDSSKESEMTESEPEELTKQTGKRGRAAKGKTTEEIAADLDSSEESEITESESEETRVVQTGKRNTRVAGIKKVTTEPTKRSTRKAATSESEAQVPRSTRNVRSESQTNSPRNAKANTPKRGKAKDTETSTPTRTNTPVRGKGKDADTSTPTRANTPKTGKGKANVKQAQQKKAVVDSEDSDVDMPARGRRKQTAASSEDSDVEVPSSQRSTRKTRRRSPASSGSEDSTVSSTRRGARASAQKTLAKSPPKRGRKR